MALRSLLLDTTGLVVGLMLPGTIFKAQRPQGQAGLFDPSAWLHIRTDDRVVMFIRQDEFGKGPYTALAMLVANELDAGSIEVWAEGASTDEAPRKTLRGASAKPACDELMLKVAATARAMLTSAASKRWGVTPEEIEIGQGVLSHPQSGSSGRFGEFAALAATLPVPGRVTLKR
ncbi:MULTISPECIES: molybdopterin cofactor-binding domain-containing protein [unclassified Sinorhizobium]|uniref:molybdopterin cofactor-binding domain-containing protein n=1 Tax=unclassified Sinorhizobium TaxID=2613772 RepID=UPI0035243431